MFYTCAKNFFKMSGLNLCFHGQIFITMYNWVCSWHYIFHFHCLSHSYTDIFKVNNGFPFLNSYLKANDFTSSLGVVKSFAFSLKKPQYIVLRTV